MKDLPILTAAILLFGAVQSAADEQQKVTIPTGTPIRARLASQLDSGEVHAGDLVTMDVLEDVRVEGRVAVPHGAVVMGHVSEAKGARKMGRGGKLNVVFETVTAGDSTKVPVTGVQTAKGKAGYGGGSLVGAGAAGLLFPPAAALLLLKHGHASVIPVGTIISVYVTADTEVISSQGSVTAAAVSVQSAPSISAKKAQPQDGTMQTMSEAPVESVADASRRLRREKAKAKTEALP